MGKKKHLTLGQKYKINRWETKKAHSCEQALPYNGCVPSLINLIQKFAEGESKLIINR